MGRRVRVSFSVTLGAAVLFVATGCAGSATRPTTARTAPHGPPTTSIPSSPSTTTATCSNLQVITGWTLSRRAAQLVVAPALNFNLDTVKAETAAGVGGILFIGDQQAPANLAARLHAALDSASPGLAPLTMVDEEGGGIQRLLPAVTSFPWPRQIAQTMTVAQTETLATSAGLQMRQLGVTVDLAPVLDLDGGAGPNATDADGSRSFSATPAIAARYGVAFVEGLRSAGVLPVVKHFPGLGGASRNTDYGPASTAPIATLRASGLLPFQAAIQAGAPAVMISNATVPGLSDLPASLSSDVIEGLLQDTLGFSGLVLTDSLSAGAITQAGYDLPHAAVAAITAGADMILFGSTLTPAQTLLLSPANVQERTAQIIDAITAAASAGTLPVNRLNDAVEHVLAAKRTNLCSNTSRGTPTGESDFGTTGS